MGREAKRRRAECILHFGMHKTGSSSIQHSLSGAGDLGSHYFLDLGTRTGNGGIVLVTLFAQRPWQHHAYRKRGLGKDDALKRLPEDRARLAAEIEAAGTRTSIISAEVLALLPESDLERVLGGIGSLVDSVRAVGYLRPPRGYMESRFQQRLQGSGRARLDFHDLYPVYRRFESFDRMLGRENVSMWKFEPASFPGGDVVRDFCGRLGIEIRTEDIRRVNESLSRPASAILYAYRRFGPGFGVGKQALRGNRIVTDALRVVPGRKLRFASSALEEVLEAHADDIAWVEERTGAEFSDSESGDEGAIRTVEDLLQIDEEALRSFLEAVQTQNEIELPSSITANLDTDPEAVARTVEACREAIRGNHEAASVRSRSDRPAAPPATSTELAVQSVESSNELMRIAEHGLTIAPNGLGELPVVVRFEPVAAGVQGPVEFAARVRGSYEHGPPVVLRLAVGDDDGRRERVLDEIEVDGSTRRDWVVPLPKDDLRLSLRLTCTQREGGPHADPARVRIARPTLRSAGRDGKGAAREQRPPASAVAGSG